MDWKKQHKKGVLPACPRKRTGIRIKAGLLARDHRLLNLPEASLQWLFQMALTYSGGTAPEFNRLPF